MTNPFDTATGRQARLTQFRLLAKGTGPVADFAKEVVAGRANSRDLLTTSWVVEDWLDDVQAEADRFRDSPDAQDEWTPEQAEEFLERHLAGVASIDVDAVEAQLRPPPVVPKRRQDNDDDEPGPPLLKDAW
jgi:hypothetical protein